MDRFVVFGWSRRIYGLPLPAVQRVVRAVEITPLPGAPDAVAGVMNLEGEVVPVLDMRPRLGLPAAPLSPADYFVIARSSRRVTALLVDEISGVRESGSGELVDMNDVVPGVPLVRGVAKLDDGMLLIHDLDAFLSLDEEAQLDHALSEAGA